MSPTVGSMPAVHRELQGSQRDRGVGARLEGGKESSSQPRARSW